MKVFLESSDCMKYDLVVVGMGPSAAFLAYELIQLNNYKNVLLIDQGKPVEKRCCPIEKAGKCLKCKPYCNITCGFSGAGAFSDGKLNTGVKDKEGRINYILDTFVKHGAKENITYDSKPHVGTDILANVIVSMREEIIKLGGTILFYYKKGMI